MSKIIEPVILDKTGQRIAESLESLTRRDNRTRIESLTDTELARASIIETVGTPLYVADVSQYEAFGITETGWYIFARIYAKEGYMVTSATHVEGADGVIANLGNDYVDVAIRFEVAAMSHKVAVDWGPYAESFVFKSTDLAVRNLDYRSTFYVYDIAPFAKWSFTKTTDSTFAEGKKYFIQAEDDEYTQAEVTAGSPAIYYEQVISYALTADATFADGKTYYTRDGETYAAAEVTTGEAVTADTYYEQVVTYVQTEDAAFQDGKTYYTSDGTNYTAAEVTVGDPIIVYYVHSKLSFEGMTRNVTYRFDEIVDAPIEITLPEVPDDGYGCWYEIQMRYNNSYSVTLLPTDPSVKIGTATTQNQTAGVNIIDLQYTDVDDIKMWTLLNTHSNIPTT